MPTGIEARPSSKSLYASLPIDTRIIIGIMIAYFTVLGGVVLFDISSNLNRCWELRVKNERLFKINRCDGAVIELDDKTMEANKN